MPIVMMGIADKQLYSTYRAEVSDNRTLESLRAGILIVAGLNSPFLILDYLVYGEVFWALAATRGSLAVILAIAYWIAPRAPQAMMVAAVLAVGFNLIAVTGLVGGVSSLYFPGLMLLFLGMPVILPLSAPQSGGIVAVLFVGFACLPGFGAGEFATREYFMNLFFPGAAAIESVFSCALLDRLRFVDYCRTAEIAAARDELAKLDDAKTRFSANVHHELRTPLTLLLAPLDGIYDGEYGPLDDKTRKIVRTMRTNGQRLLKLINDLLDLAKLENQRFSVSPVPLSLAGLLDDLVEGVRSLAELKDVSIDTANLSELESISADRDALEKVFMNLLGNAIKFTEPGGSILVEGENVKEGVQVRIVDTGIGLEAEQLSRIFDRFAQVDTSTTRKHEGTGIGLSLASELVGLHNGKLWASSPGVGQGVTMTVLLPLKQPLGEQEADNPSTAECALSSLPINLSSKADMKTEYLPAQPSKYSATRFVDLDMEVNRWIDQARETSNWRDIQPQFDDERPVVLVVDDNSDMRELLSHTLGPRFNVRCARNGREALEALDVYEPLLVITDIMMPELSGTELCATIKTSDRLNEIPVMIISSKAEREMKIQGLELGADDYVTKPFHPREVLARATSLVNLRRAQKEIRLRNSELQRALDELRITQAQLVQKERLAAVGEIAAGIAHEVNNPVNFALNAARALRSSTSEIREIADAASNLDWLDPSKVAKEGEALQCRIQELGIDVLSDTVDELTSIIEQGLDRTRRLVGDLRDFAAPNRRLPDRKFDIRDSIESTMQLLQHEYSRLAIESRTSLPDGPALVSGDEDALGQVFLNVLKNAVQALEFWDQRPTTLQPYVQLTCVINDSEIVIEVSDNGPGVDAAITSRLFEPFFTTTKFGAGTGLGLSTCKGIVVAHGGRIGIDSDLSEGATFRISLPRASSDQLA